MTSTRTRPRRRRPSGPRAGLTLGMARRGTTVVGLDLGSTALRACEMVHRAGGSALERAAAVPVSPGAVQGGVVEDPKAVAAAVRALWSAGGFRSKRVVLGLTHHQLLVRELTVPPLDRSDLARALPFLVKETLPFPPDQALLDFHPFGPAADGSGGTDGLVVAAPKQAVVDAVDAVHRGGLFVERVDLAAFAAMHATGAGVDGAQVLVDIGAYATNVVAHTDGVPRMVRCVPRGGAEITALIALRHDLGIDEAEARKRRVGLRATDPADVELAETVDEAVRPLVREIRSSLAWFSAHRPDEPVARLVVCGGGAALPGLIDTLADRLATPVEVADATVALRGGARARHAAPEQIEAAAAVSVGLALAGAPSTTGTAVAR